MGNLSIRMAEHLYWLGRYLERIEEMGGQIIRCFDYVIDRNFDEGKDFYKRIGVNLEYENGKDFLWQATFGTHLSSLENLVKNARENAIICRDVISDKIFSSINNAYNILNDAKNNQITPFEVEQILKDTDRVWGVLFGKLKKSKAHYFIEFGQAVEIVDLKIRLYDDFEDIGEDVETIEGVGKKLSSTFGKIYFDKNSLLNQVNYAIYDIIKYD